MTLTYNHLYAGMKLTNTKNLNEQNDWYAILKGRYGYLELNRNVALFIF